METEVHGPLNARQREALARAEAEGVDRRGLAMQEEPTYAWTDTGKMRQILINLIGNAGRYTKEGMIKVAIDRSGAEWYAIHVRDTGPGIQPDDQERIFEPFTQVDSSHTRMKDGAGLGLAIARRLAALLGGGITLQSVPGEGSTFTVRLPRSVE